MALVSSLAGGCSTGLGPKALRSERPDYNQQIQRSTDAEMLLNLVRLRYNDSPLFLEVGSVVATYTYDGSLNLSSTIAGSGGSTGLAGTTLAYGEHPTVTYTPLTGEDFAERMLSPIPLDFIMLFEQTGWNVETLFLVAVQRINDVYNARTATGPLPETKPDYEEFADFAARFDDLRSAGLIGLNWEMKVGEKDPPGRDPHFWFKDPDDPQSPLAADLARIRRDLGLKPGRSDYQLTAFPFRHTPHEVGLRCRSLLGVLYYLSKAVQPPAADVQAGRVPVTRDENGEVFDWSKVTGKVMNIRSQSERPEKAYLAVQYRDSWFYIADDDQTSKSTFSLLNILFSLQSASGKGKSPVLTLPVGR